MWKDQAVPRAMVLDAAPFADQDSLGGGDLHRFGGTSPAACMRPRVPRSCARRRPSVAAPRIGWSSNRRQRIRSEKDGIGRDAYSVRDDSFHEPGGWSV